MANVHYFISIADPHKHLFNIKINVTPTGQSAMSMSLPNWIPGSYMIRDFSKHILDLQANDHTGQLAIQKITKSDFKIAHHGQPFTISYHVYAFDLSVRKAYLDQEFGFINPTSSLFQIDQFAQHNCLVTIVPPSKNLTQCQNWRPATGLPQQNSDGLFQYGTYSAANYIELTDYPILYGELDIATFEVENVPHYMITVGRHFGDLNRVVKDLKPLCQYHVDTFGGLPKDLDKYLFLTMVTDQGFGGLEHLNSTALVCSRFDIANENQQIDEGYTTFLSLCSHEYLHTWNVKRLKPKEFIPYKLDQEVYTKQLWFYEGMTSYFDDLSLVHTKTISQSQYLELLAKTLTRIQKGIGQMRQTVTESSFDTWTKFYQQDHTAPDQIVSYYQKGAAIACLADLIMLDQSDGQNSLRNLMKEAWLKFGDTGVGTTQDDLELLFIKHLGEQHRDWLHQVLYGKTKIDIQQIFGQMGILVNKHNQSDPSQLHGNNLAKRSHRADNETNNPQMWLGAVTTENMGYVEVKQILTDSPIEVAGVAVGDKLVAINNIRVTAKNLQKLINLKGGASMVLHYFRKDQLITAELTPTTSPEFLVELAVNNQNKVDVWLGNEV